MCRYFGCSRSGYYKAVLSKEVELSKENIIVELVQNIRHTQPKTGGRKLYFLLKKDLDKLDGRSTGRDKFFDVLRSKGLLVKRKKKYVRTTHSWHRFHTYKNMLKKRTLKAPGQACVSDITYLRTETGFVYLFLQTDAYSRMITGWHLSESLGIEGAIKALKMTLRQCRNTDGFIHHSDRGIQYCCKEYVQLLENNKVKISMTEDNHCYENAIAERVNGILKDEFLLDTTFRNKKQTLKAVKQAIDTYNNQRPHWSLNLSTPAQIHKAA